MEETRQTKLPIIGPTTIGIKTEKIIRMPWNAPTLSCGIKSRTAAFIATENKHQPSSAGIILIRKVKTFFANPVATSPAKYKITDKTRNFYLPKRSISFPIQTISATATIKTNAAATIVAGVKEASTLSKLKFKTLPR